MVPVIQTAVLFQLLFHISTIKLTALQQPTRARRKLTGNETEGHHAHRAPQNAGGDLSGLVGYSLIDGQTCEIKAIENPAIPLIDPTSVATMPPSVLVP